MNTRLSSAAFSGIAIVAVCLASAGCQGQADKDSIDAAPPTAPNAKAPAPVVGKPGPVGGADSASGGGSSSEVAPAAVGGK